MQDIKLRARAKINLTLDVTGKRPNGYHDLCMIMQTLALYDGVYIKKIEKPIVRLKTNLSWLPTDQRNLAYKAAELLRQKYNIKEGVFILLQKNIPIAAGLAGGSADCAAVLVGINRLFDLKLSKSELMHLALSLGTDIPYCIMRGTALAKGLGNELTTIRPPCPQCFVVLVKPPVSVSTAHVYQHLDLGSITKRPDTTAMLEYIRQGDIKKIGSGLVNVLENVTIPMHTDIRAIKESLIKLGAVGSLMSGSGPTVFGLFESLKTAESAVEVIKNKYCDCSVILTSIWGQEERLGV